MQDAEEPVPNAAESVDSMVHEVWSPLLSAMHMTSSDAHMPRTQESSCVNGTT